MSRRGVFDRIMNKEEYMQPEQTAVPVKLSDSTTQDPDELVECPYDKIHRIRVSRFPMHLLKCRKNYSGREMFTCPFNARHIVPKPEARHHVANCPDKAAIEKEMLQGFESNNTYCKGYIKVPSYHKNDVYPPPTENWDDEISRTRNTEQEYWGPDDGTGEESGRHQLPRPKGRGAPRAVGHMQSDQPPKQPEMRLPRQPAQAAAMAQQRHQQLQQQQNHVAPQQAAAPPQVQVVGLGRGQVKGRKMAANLWGGAQPQSQHHKPEGHGQEIQGQIQGHLQGVPPARGHAASNAQASPPRPGGLGHSSWANQAAHNGPTKDSYKDDYPALGDAPQPKAAPLGLGRGLGRGSILTNPAPGMQY